MLRAIAHSRMVHVRVLEAYINIVLLYTGDHNTNQRPDKRIWQANQAIKSCSRYETINVKFMCFIFSMCCTKI